MNNVSIRKLLVALSVLSFSIAPLLPAANLITSAVVLGICLTVVCVVYDKL